MRLFDMIKSIAIILFSIILLAILTGEAHALGIEMSIEELCSEAESIIIGKVKSKKSAWNKDQTNIYTEVIVSVEKSLKGENKQDEIKIVIPGGEVDGISQYVSNTPAFKPGEKAILFLNELTLQYIFGQNYQPKLYQITGNAQGKIAIHDTEDKDFTKNEQEESINNDTEEYTLTAQSEFVYNGFRWPGTYPSVNYYVNAPSPSKNTNIQSAADTWSNAGANFSFDYAGTHSRTGKAMMNGINEIMWYDLETNYALAVATIWFSGDRILENDMVFNTRFNWSTTIPALHGYYDVQTVALHEFGHWLSLGHSQVYEAVMYYQIKGIQRHLHSDDIAGIQYIYGAEDVQPEEYAVSISANPVEGGTVSGGGNYDHGQEVNLTATAAAGYAFISWIEVDEVVCNDPDYSFNAEADRNLVANFTEAAVTPETPALISPVHGEIVQGSSVLLEWAPAAGATHYAVWIYNLTTDKQVIFSAPIEGTSYAHHGLTGNGDIYAWSVVASNIEDGTWGDFAIPLVFIDGSDKDLLPPTLISPEHYENVPGTQIELQWEAPVVGTHYAVWVYNLTKDEQVIFTAPIEETSYILGDLADNGDVYAWSVVASNIDDQIWSDFAFPRIFVNE